MTVGITDLTMINHKIQHKRKYAMIYDTILDIVLIFRKLRIFFFHLDFDNCIPMLASVSCVFCE